MADNPKLYDKIEWVMKAVPMNILIMYKEFIKVYYFWRKTFILLVYIIQIWRN